MFGNVDQERVADHLAEKVPGVTATLNLNLKRLHQSKCLWVAQVELQCGLEFLSVE
jgi:hypothetical protein